MSTVYGVFDNDLDCVAVDGKETLQEAFELACELVEEGAEFVRIKYPCVWNRAHSGYTVISDDSCKEIFIDAAYFNE